MKTSHVALVELDEHAMCNDGTQCRTPIISPHFAPSHGRDRKLSRRFCTSFLLLPLSASCDIETTIEVSKIGTEDVRSPDRLDNLEQGWLFVRPSSSTKHWVGRQR